jgi:hypothetical protein
VKIRQVRFTIKVKDAFDLDAAKEVIKKKGYDEVTLLVGPT